MTSWHPPQPTGLLETGFLKLVARAAEVRTVEAIGRFRRVVLAGPDLVGRSWTPGDMIQIALGGWAARAYTPIAYDASAGTMELLAYVHGHGIGSAWFESLARGAQCWFVGPRGAIDLYALRRPLVVFGDETSLATVAALRATAAGLNDVIVVLEVDDVDGTRAVVDELGLHGDIRVVARGEAHLDAIESQLHEAFAAHRATQGVLTGRASSIQRLYKALRRAGVRDIKNVAYWAPGRKGFSGAQR